MIVTICAAPLKNARQLHPLRGHLSCRHGPWICRALTGHRARVNIGRIISLSSIHPVWHGRLQPVCDNPAHDRRTKRCKTAANNSLVLLGCWTCHDSQNSYCTMQVIEISYSRHIIYQLMYTFYSRLRSSIRHTFWDLNILLRDIITNERCSHLLDGLVQVILKRLHRTCKLGQQGAEKMLLSVLGSNFVTVLRAQ